MTTFSDFALGEPILKAPSPIKAMPSPTPIQAQAISPILAGRDLCGIAQTGTGKTAAFALPILQRLAADRRDRGCRAAPRVLVLTPTRELASQIAQSFRTYGAGLRLTDRRHLRRRLAAPAGRGAEARRRHPRRHAGPAARPRSSSGC